MWKLVILICASVSIPLSECESINLPVSRFESLDECKQAGESQIKATLPIARKHFPEGRLGARCFVVEPDVWG